MLIKICGITCHTDAEIATRLGANWIGMLFTSQSKRRVSIDTARDIVLAAQSQNAQAVGVFVDESPQEILDICEQTGIQIVQLHGPEAQKARPHLPAHYSVIQAIAIPEKAGHSSCEYEGINASWLLFDSKKGGSGQAFNWHRFQPPARPWLLAGGLNAKNVIAAIHLLAPHGVDVSSGVEAAGTVRKDPILIKKFIRAVQSAANIKGSL